MTAPSSLLLRLHIRTSHPLVCIRRLLYLDPLAVLAIFVVVGASTRTAAHAEEPKEASAEGEGDGKPDCNVHGVAEGAMDLVGFENVVEGSGEDAVKGGGGYGEGYEEEGATLERVSI